MALGTISFEQEPISDTANVPVITNWTPIIPYTTKQTDITDLFYFKFILEIRIDDASGTLLGKIKQRPNGHATGTTNVIGIFDVRSIVNSQLEDTRQDQNDTTKSIHTLGSNVAAKIFSLNYNQLKTIYVKAYQQYSNSATEIPAEITTTTVNDTKRYIAASLPLQTPRGTADFQTSTAFASYSINSSTSKFLSDVEDSNVDFTRTSLVTGLGSAQIKINYVQSSDYHTIAFVNGQVDFSSKAARIGLKYFDNTNSLLGTYFFDNTNANGGAIPLTGTTEVDTDAERLIYFGCGPANLQAQSINTSARPSNFSSYVYYVIFAVDNTTGSNVIVSDSYYFFKQSASCKEYKTRRLAWRNSLGAYDYFNFKMKSSQTVEVDKNTYESMIGNFNSDMYSYDNTQRGKKVRKTTAILKETINTEWISEQDANLLEGLIKSTNVEIIENADTDFTEPVLITDKSFVRKTTANDGIKIKYTFNIEYANPLNTNS